MVWTIVDGAHHVRFAPEAELACFSWQVEGGLQMTLTRRPLVVLDRRP